MDDTNFSRDIRLYWPEHIQSIKEFQEIDKAVDIEIEKLWDALKTVLNNRYLSLMDQSECLELENMLNIQALPSDTLEDRVRRIKGYFVSNLPYTQNKLIEVLNVLCGGEDNYILLVEPKNYTIHIGLKLAVVRLVDNVREIVSNMVPANMIWDVYVVFNRWQRFKTVTWGTLKAKTWTEMRNDEAWQKEAMMR